MSGERFTSWLSAEERTALRALARELNCSENFIVRMALRAALFNATVPDYIKTIAAEQFAAASNTSNTSNAENHTTGAHA